MKNKYLRNLKKIEFVVTSACTGRCKHCSEGYHRSVGDMIDSSLAAESVRRVAAEYPIETVMTFGGEPLLHLEAVDRIMNAATECEIPRRQVITNGYFTNSRARMEEVARRLRLCGVNDLLLSVDAFHQEAIPLETVRAFALALKSEGVPVRLQPAWLVTPSDRNPYNLKTREILDSLSDLELPESEGNLVFPEGNATEYLSEYFKENAPKNPYTEDPCDVKCISFSPRGDVLDGNIHQKSIMEIIEAYSPS